MFTTESIKCVIFFWLKERAEENVYVSHNLVATKFYLVEPK